MLVGPLGYPAKRAVPLNLAASLFTLIASLLIRGNTLTVEPSHPFRYGIGALIAGAIVAAYFGTALAGRLSEDRLHRVIVWLLWGIGGLLLIEAFLPETLPALLPPNASIYAAAGIMLGLGIGLVSSLLGVAGGELIIPTMVFIFGADIKTAGTASLVISIPIVIVGVIRYARRGQFAERRAMLNTVAPMGVGSVIGAVLGGLMVGLVSPAVLKLVLGPILIVSASRMYAHRRDRTTA